MMDASFPVLLKVTLLNEGKYDIRNIFFLRFRISMEHTVTGVKRLFGVLCFFDPFLQRKKIETYMD